MSFSHPFHLNQFFLPFEDLFFWGGASSESKGEMDLLFDKAVGSTVGGRGTTHDSLYSHNINDVGDKTVDV